MIGVNAATTVVGVWKIPYRFLSFQLKFEVYYQIVFKKWCASILMCKKPMIFLLA